MLKHGTLLKSVGGLCTVLTDDGEMVSGSIRGRFRLDGVKPLVGDRVVVSDADGGRLEELLPRRNALVRPPLANIDCLLLVLSQAPPRSDPMLADQMTVAAAHMDISVVVAINKSDLDDGRVWCDRFAATGYPVYPVSALDSAGIADLRAALTGKTIALAGMSGVGKSSLLNVLYPGLALQIGQISERLHLGKHTTRHVELLPVGNGCLIADTPGFTIFDAACVKTMTRNELAVCYPEMRPYVHQCRYRNCRHEQDEGCAVLQAVSDGHIHPERHASYVELAKDTVDTPRK